MTETQNRTAQLVAETAAATAKTVLEAAKAAAVLISDEHKANENSTLTKIVRLEEQMANLKAQQDKFETEITKKIDAIFMKLDDISKGRPSLAITTTITILSVICTGLIVYFVTRY